MKNESYEVLLVDDDCNDIELAMLAFERSNLAPRVQAFDDGETALRCLQDCSRTGNSPDRPPRLVILDLKMPKVDGFEVLKEIRRSEKIDKVPVVILTSSRLPSDIERSYRLGCSAYVVKPVNHREYTRTLNSLVDFWCGHNLTPLD